MKNTEIHSNFIRFFTKSKKIIPKSSNCCNLMRNKAFSVRIASFESHLNRVFFKVLLNGGQSILMVKLELWNFPKKTWHFNVHSETKIPQPEIRLPKCSPWWKTLILILSWKMSSFVLFEFFFRKSLSCKLEQERMEKITFLVVKIG